MKYLQGIQNKCRCGAIASAIKEENKSKSGNITDRRIVYSNCKSCGLKYVADDMKDAISDEYAETIQSFNK